VVSVEIEKKRFNMLAHNVAIARPDSKLNIAKTNEISINLIESDGTRHQQEGERRGNVVDLISEKKPKEVFLLEGSYIETLPHLIQDVVFLDPPWPGEGSYKGLGRLACDDIKLGDVTLLEICRVLLDRAKFIVLKLPLTFHVEQLVEKLRQDGNGKHTWHLRSPIRWKGSKMLLLVLDLEPIVN